MVNLKEPFTYENSNNPWLVTSNNPSKCIKINDKFLSAEYLWSLNSSFRKTLLNDVFEYYRKRGFPFPKMTDEEIQKDFKTLLNKNTKDIVNEDGQLKNSGVIGIGITHHFCSDLFYSATGDKGTLSPLEVFNNDDLFIKALKNRMGWNCTNEDGTTRPYMFDINDKCILNGLKNSGLAREASNFRPTIAKYMYEYAAKLLNKDKITIFDYSCGWGARALGALSLGYDYYGTDPLTFERVGNLIEYFGSDRSKIYSYGSQDKSLIDTIGNKTIDCCGSCPPYFTMERYDLSETQCYNEFNNYSDWLENYWRYTCKVCNSLMKDKAVFELVIKDKYGEFDMKDDMLKIVSDEIAGIKSIKEIPYKTSKNHLTGKHKTGIYTKANEYLVIIYRDING